ncbi:M23 family metallopeptidase [Trujillonella endophytica]|uniref:Peptidase family M23 n=1 Tax=Trujillonella endophytica TaxID=673521 RepID=A0A1H8WPE3_9ACTN|nr:M23 family metallopeptidase [Trujillella endophytica]SEP29515.1 Peptidase family M23 [Trujillella endophytica]
MKMKMATTALALLVASLGGSIATAAPADAAPARTAVWVGSPIEGTWPTSDGCSGSGARYPSDDCSLPTAHHTYQWGMPYTGDWGIDIGASAGQAVTLYAAPQQGGRSIGAKVERVTLACSARSGESYEQTRRRGGNTVVVGLYEGGTRIGWVTYAHVDPYVSQGQSINRWNTTIGTVGRYSANSCWTGPHLHVEMTNETNYSCYNRGWRPGQQMYRSNFIGFLGGAYASGTRQACP